MGQRVSGCFGHGQRHAPLPYIIVSDPFAKPTAPQRKDCSTVEAWLSQAQNVDNMRSLEEQSTASTEVHSSHMQLDPETGLVSRAPDNTRDFVVEGDQADQSIDSHGVRCELDDALDDIPISASPGGTAFELVS